MTYGPVVHGVEEDNNGDDDQAILDVLDSDMRKKITTQDVDRSHWLGKKNTRYNPKINYFQIFWILC